MRHKNEFYTTHPTHQMAAAQYFEETITGWETRLRQGLRLDTVEETLNQFRQWSDLTIGQFLRGLNNLQAMIISQWRDVADPELYPWLIRLQKTTQAYLADHPAIALANFRQEILLALQSWREMTIVGEIQEALPNRIEILLTQMKIYRPYVEETVYEKTQQQLNHLATLKIDNEITAIAETEQVLETYFQRSEWQQFFRLSWAALGAHPRASLPPSRESENPANKHWKSLSYYLNTDFLARTTKILFSLSNATFTTLHHALRYAGQHPFQTMSYLLLGQSLVAAVPTLSDTFFTTLGGSSDKGRYVQILPNNNLVVAGNTFGSGPIELSSDVLLATFNGNTGNLLSAKTLGGANDDDANSVQVLPNGNLIVTGTTRSFGAGAQDVILAKFNGTGDLLWAKTLGGGDDDISHAAQVLPNGNLAITGEIRTINGTSIFTDMFLATLSSTGDLLWAKKVGTSGYDSGRSIQVLPNGDLVVTGFTVNPGAADDILLAKFHGITGDLLWAKTLGGDNEDVGFSVQVLPNGNLIVTGTTRSFGAGAQDVILAKFNGTGDLLWAKTLGGENDDYDSSVQVLPNGNVVVVASTWSFGAGFQDAIIATFNSSTGDLLGAKTFGGSDYDRISCLQVSSNGDLVVTGTTRSFGTGSHDHLLLAKFNNDGKIYDCNIVQAINGVTVTNITPNVSTSTIFVTDFNPTVIDYSGVMPITSITPSQNYPCTSLLTTGATGPMGTTSGNPKTTATTETTQTPVTTITTGTAQNTNSISTMEITSNVQTTTTISTSETQTKSQPAMSNDDNRSNDIDSSKKTSNVPLIIGLSVSGFVLIVLVVGTGPYVRKLRRRVNTISGNNSNTPLASHSANSQTHDYDTMTPSTPLRRLKNFGKTHFFPRGGEPTAIKEEELYSKEYFKL